MLFKGSGRTFSTENDQQYETIGAFWDELAAKYGRANLQGLGYGWKYEIDRFTDSGDCEIMYCRSTGRNR